MALKSGLSLYCYQLGTAALGQVGPIDYGRQVERLSFTTTAPGGYGTLEATLKLRNVHLPRPELSIFARCVLVGHGENGQRTVFLGEILQPEIGYSQSDGEYIKISALGVGSFLRDDPRTLNFVTQTAQQIAQFQITVRSVYLPLSQDVSQVFPDNPAGTYSIGYINRTGEEIIGDIATQAGDYQWGTWAHPLGEGPGQTAYQDAVGFPLGRLTVIKRDPNTLHYTASLKARDLASYRIMPTPDRAYNNVSIDYYDPTQTTPVGTYDYQDPRLAVSGAQQNAPFRRRKYARDLSGSTAVTLAQATALANLYGAQMQNVTNKEELVLKSVRDANGNEIPLWAVRADHNLGVPEMAVLGNQLATTYTPGVNQFYILSTRYEEASTGEPQLTLQCDNYFDLAADWVARLQNWSDRMARDNRSTVQIQRAGANIYAGAGTKWANATAGSTMTLWVNFPSVCATVPSGITLTADISTLNVSGSASVDHITVNGFRLKVVALATGDVEWIGHYQTVGL